MGIDSVGRYDELAAGAYAQLDRGAAEAAGETGETGLNVGAEIGFKVFDMILDQMRQSDAQLMKMMQTVNTAAPGHIDMRV